MGHHVWQIKRKVWSVFVRMLRRSLIAKLAALVAILALASTAAGCGMLTGYTVGGGPPSMLQCNQTAEGHGVDVINMKLTCQASGAASGDTSFQLHYSIKDGNGNTRTFDATCDGTLQNGAGSCSQTYALVVPFASGDATVSGEFLPSHKGLGPFPLPQNK